MVTVENVRAGAYYNRATGHTNVGDRVDVSESVAAYLCDTRGDFRRVDVTETGYDDEENAGDSSSGETTDDYTCAGNDGDCSRSVNESGAYCWQHQPD